MRIVRIALAVFLAAHGLLHLLGAAKAFDIAALPALSQPISRPIGLLWLGAAVGLLAAAVAVLGAPSVWWVIGAAAVVLSQVAIVTSWPDAKYGTGANLVLLLAIIAAYRSDGPSSDRAAYRREVARRLAVSRPTARITDKDLAPLPPLVQRYLRLTGVVGGPLIANFRARIHGEIRSGAEAGWMPFTGEQHNFYDDPARLFILHASRMGLPVQALHRYLGSAATMRVQVASLVTIADAKGPTMDQSETVTMFNDMCVYAPGALIDPRIQWEAVDSRTVNATFTNAGHTVRATLHFDETGQLIDFVSDDRSASSADGKTFSRTRWSTPLSAYRAYGGYRLSSRGEGHWHPAQGEYVYIRVVLDEIEYNLSRPSSGRP